VLKCDSGSKNLENMIFSLKTTLSSMMKTYNEKLLDYLAEYLGKLLEKGGSESPLDKSAFSLSSKTIFKTISQVIKELYSI